MIPGRSHCHDEAHVTVVELPPSGRRRHIQEKRCWSQKVEAHTPHATGTRPNLKRTHCISLVLPSLALMPDALRPKRIRRTCLRLLLQLTAAESHAHAPRIAAPRYTNSLALNASRVGAGNCVLLRLVCSVSVPVCLSYLCSCSECTQLRS